MMGNPSAKKWSWKVWTRSRDHRQSSSLLLFFFFDVVGLEAKRGVCNGECVTLVEG